MATAACIEDRRILVYVIMYIIHILCTRIRVSCKSPSIFQSHTLTTTGSRGKHSMLYVIQIYKTKLYNMTKYQYSRKKMQVHHVHNGFKVLKIYQNWLGLYLLFPLRVSSKSHLTHNISQNSLSFQSSIFTVAYSFCFEIITLRHVCYLSCILHNHTFHSPLI